MYKKYLITFCFLALNSYQILDLFKVNKLNAQNLKESKEINLKGNFKKNLNTKANTNNRILLIETLPLLAENIEQNILNESSNEIEISSDTQFQNKKFLTMPMEA